MKQNIKEKAVKFLQKYPSLVILIISVLFYYKFSGLLLHLYGSAAYMVVLEEIIPYAFTEYRCKDIQFLGGDSAGMDGSWPVCFDHWNTKKNEPCVSFFFGVNWDFSFEDSWKGETVTRGRDDCVIHSFDPSLFGLEDVKRDGGYFWKWGLGNYTSDEHIGEGMDGRSSKWKVSTVKGFMEKLNTTQIDVLKIDVEGSELDALELAVRDGSLRNVNQLLIEVHYYKNEYSRFWNLYKSLSDEGFQLFYYHTNPASSPVKYLGIHFACCYEIALIRVPNSRN